jgi:hypothetical protein
LAAGLVAPATLLPGQGLALNQKVRPRVSSTKQAVVGSEMTVFRSPTCGCCGQWIEHMKAAGFSVQDNSTDDLQSVKQQYGIPTNLTSCHTAMVEGYVVEGHVPAGDVQRLLAEKPDVVGIAVRGMPMGSPGMESGNRVEPYTVLSFTEQGETAVFAQHS